MDESLRVDASADAPLYRQIVGQVAFLIEVGDLTGGDRLPSVRLLADNLGINRNTVARAYAELRDRGLVVARGRAGTVVIGAEHRDVRTDAERGPAGGSDEHARRILGAAVRECLALGLPPDLIESMVGDVARRAPWPAPVVTFVECTTDGAADVATELGRRLDLVVRPRVLGTFDPAATETDLVVTTFFHLAEVRAAGWPAGTPIVATVVAPHIRSLVKIAAVPKDRIVGICYSTEHQALRIRDSLAQAGIENIRVIDTDLGADPDGTDLHAVDLQGVELVVIPSGRPDLTSALGSRVEVVEFGNVLDQASVATVAEALHELPRLPPAPHARPVE